MTNSEVINLRRTTSSNNMKRHVRRANPSLGASNYSVLRSMPDWRTTITHSSFLMGTIELAKAYRLFSIANCRNYSYIVCGSCRREECLFSKPHSICTAMALIARREAS
jgi:hypothetical protein